MANRTGTAQRPNGSTQGKICQFKLVLLGESAVGKSSLVLRFVKGQFHEYQESTIGAAFLTQTVCLDDTTVKFEIWDTAGQERYHSLAPMYYRGAQAAIVVYDITNQDTFGRAKTWVKELQRQASPTIVIALAGNKQDLANKRMVEFEEAQTYADENGLLFMETSAKTAMNVNDIFLAIGKLTRAFLSLLERSDGANYSLNNRPITIFAPINQAFQVFAGAASGDPNQLVLYHIANVPRAIDELGTSYASINTEVEGNPPVWITHTTGSYHNDIYVNNARLLVSQSNQRFSNPKGMDQILHKIDEVLVSPRAPKQSVYNPSALDFMESYEKLIMHPHRLRSFRQRVKQTKREDIYKIEGGHTFFIPVDEGFKDKRADLIDERIIDGHVIPKKVLFTAPTKKDHPFDTLANSDNSVRVVVSFTQENRGPNNIIHYVKSHTLFSDGRYAQGVVLSEIVKANIPVKNGVVHLIQKPLMLVDNNVRELLEERDGGILSSFVKAINDADYKEFYNTLERSQDITLFAPCNNAWTDDYTLNSMLSNKNRFKDILKMHLVADNRLYVNKIIQIANGQDKRVHTLDPRNDLYFNVVTIGPNRTMTVEGGGVNATVIQPDLAATNGVIHIIDRVLGIPYTTVFDKLRTDYSLNYTYHLGKYGGFNNQLNDTTKKFTYFVPRNRAWEEAGVDHPSAVKKLFMPEFHYHANNILERHLVISDQPYTMERIKQLSAAVHNENHYGQRTEVHLTTIRGELSLSVEESNDHTFIIHWKGERIPVFRPNVACTNGIIHVIDAPFLQDGDIQVSRAVSLYFAPHVFMITAAKWLLM